MNQLSKIIPIMFQQQISPWSVYDNFHKKPEPAVNPKIQLIPPKSQNKSTKQSVQLIRSNDNTAHVYQEKKTVIGLLDRLAMLKVVKNQVHDTTISKKQLTLPLPSLNSVLAIHRSQSLDQYKPKGRVGRHHEGRSKFKYHHQLHKSENIGHQERIEQFSQFFTLDRPQQPQNISKKAHILPRIDKANNIFLSQLPLHREQFDDQNIFATLETARRPNKNKRRKLSSLAFDYLS